MVPRRGRSRIRRRLGDRQGTVSIEFAVLAFPFLLLVMGTLDLGIMMLQATVMYGALEQGARQLRTGVVQAADNPIEAFKTIVCDNLYVLMKCDDIAFDVDHFDSYSDIVYSNPTLDENGMPSDTGFQPGGAGDITLVRIYSQYNFVTPFLGTLFDHGPKGRLLTYALIVKGEPWD